MTDRLVVIGGDAAGMSAASQARRRRGPDDLEILAFERGPHTSYSACGIPYLVGGVVTDPDRLVARWPQQFRDRFGIDVRTRHEVIGIDLGGRHVVVHDLEAGSEFREPFDQLVVATGARPIRPRLEGSDAAGIHSVQTLSDGVAITEDIRDRSPRRAVVVGAGYIGLEMAEAFARLGLETTLVELDEQPMRTLDPDMGALVAHAIRAVGVTLLTGQAVSAFETSGGRVTGVIAGGRTIPADIVALGLGSRPDVSLAADAGIDVGTSGGIVTDIRMRTSSEGVWAAGDCVEVFHRVSRRPAAIALGTHANKQGRVAGINIGGGYATFPGVVGT
ncbi:MAG TPA: FAD-dependent oxidoreductase, partial [Actinomycetota bacterium]|nr:FAD-dependent oxidoreductase [Actinomycetota bacterium]